MPATRTVIGRIAVDDLGVGHVHAAPLAFDGYGPRIPPSAAGERDVFERELGAVALQNDRGIRSGLEALQQSARPDRQALPVINAPSVVTELMVRLHIAQQRKMSVFFKVKQDITAVVDRVTVHLDGQRSLKTDVLFELPVLKHDDLFARGASSDCARAGVVIRLVAALVFGIRKGIAGHIVSECAQRPGNAHRHAREKHNDGTNKHRHTTGAAVRKRAARHKSLILQ